MSKVKCCCCCSGAQINVMQLLTFTPDTFNQTLWEQVRQIPVTLHDIDPEMGDDDNELDEVEKEVADQKTVE